MNSNTATQTALKTLSLPSYLQVISASDKTPTRNLKVYFIDTFTDSGAVKLNELLKTDSWLFQTVEKLFDKWIDSTNPASEYQDKYFSEDAIYTKKGAIRGAIENMMNEMAEEGVKWGYLNNFDIEAAFSD